LLLETRVHADDEAAARNSGNNRPASASRHGRLAKVVRKKVFFSQRRLAPAAGPGQVILGGERLEVEQIRGPAAGGGGQFASWAQGS
jgi:hypothetical protein